MSLDRRTIFKILGAFPFLGWVDPIRAISSSVDAIQYRATHDGRILFKLLRDRIRNGLHYTDLEQILGPFKLFGPKDHDYTQSAAPGYPDFEGVDVSRGHFIVEYEMTISMVVHIELRDGCVVNLVPEDYNNYPVGLEIRDGELCTIDRPLDEVLEENPTTSGNLEAGGKRSNE